MSNVRNVLQKPALSGDHGVLVRSHRPPQGACRVGPDFVRVPVRTALQEVLEAEMSETLGATKGERTPGQLGYRAGHYSRTLVKCVGKLELRVPQLSSGYCRPRAAGAGSDSEASRHLRRSDGCAGNCV